MLAVHHISKTYGITPVLSDISFSIKPAEKVALIGPNGCGKTTLLRIVVGEARADSGTFHLNPVDLSVGYLSQGFDFQNGQTVGEYIDQVSGDPAALAVRLESLATQCLHSVEDIKVQQEYETTLSLIEDCAQRSASVPAILASLDLDVIPRSQPLTTLSGGQKTRLGLAGILITNPRLLLLDEPTNHLDFTMLEWLETWLQTSRCATLLVSHDRVFLDRVVTTILEIDGVTHTMKSYAGNYSDYLEYKDIERSRHWQAYQDQQDQIRDLTRAAHHVRGLATFHKGGKADTGDKFAHGFFANRGLATVKRAKHIEARIDKLLNEDHIEKPRDAWRMHMDFKDGGESGRDVLVLRDLAVGYGHNVILNGLNAVVRYGERVALVGANGCGKTTLLRTAVGELPALAGICRLGASVVPGYIAQEQEELKSGTNALEVFQLQASINETASRAFLHKYLFSGDEVFTPVASLSYGQRSRLALACLVARGCNFLMLDEPLNHLDLPSRIQFEAALADFNGTILTVVHDRYFIQRYATCIWQIQDGNLIDIGGVN